MRRKDFIRRCGMGVAVIAVSAAMLSNNGEVKAGSNAKISGLAGISLFVDNAYVQGENRVVKAKLDSVVPVDEVLSSFNSNLVFSAANIGLNVVTSPPAPTFNIMYPTVALINPPTASYIFFPKNR